jgi:16S rRNA G966 N2-methylase RsmD
MLEHRGWLAGARVIDLYAGSGALGIEALSRGARAVVFVEASSVVVRTLRGNLRVSGFTRRAEVMPMVADRALRTLERRGVRVDGISPIRPAGCAAADRLWPGRRSRPGWLAGGR